MWRTIFGTLNSPKFKYLENRFFFKKNSAHSFKMLSAQISWRDYFSQKKNFFQWLEAFFTTRVHGILQINFPWVFPDFLLFPSIFFLSSGDEKCTIFPDNVERNNVLTTKSIIHEHFYQSVKERFINTKQWFRQKTKL